MSGLEQAPFSSVITKSKIVAISGTTMITRAPWPNGQYYRLRKVDIASSTMLSGIGGTFNFWDQDLSSTTTASQGSGSAPLLIIGTNATGVSLSGFNTTVVSKPMDACPRVPFYAGITMNGTVGATVTLELEVC